MLHIERIGGCQERGEGLEPVPVARLLGSLHLEPGQRFGNDVIDRSLDEHPAAIPERPAEERFADRLDVRVDAERFVVDGDGREADAWCRQASRAEHPVGQRLADEGGVLLVVVERQPSQSCDRILVDEAVEVDEQRGSGTVERSEQPLLANADRADRHAVDDDVGPAPGEGAREVAAQHRAHVARFVADGFPVLGRE